MTKGPVSKLWSCATLEDGASHVENASSELTVEQMLLEMKDWTLVLYIQTHHAHAVSIDCSLRPQTRT